MRLRLTTDMVRHEVLDRVETLSGQQLLACYQCGRCSAGCPVVDEMDIVPSEVIRLLQLGQIGPQGRQRLALGPEQEVLEVGLEPDLGFLRALGPVWSVRSVGELAGYLSQDVDMAADPAGLLRLLPGRSQRLAQLVEQGPMRVLWRGDGFFFTSSTTRRIASSRS